MRHLGGIPTRIALVVALSCAGVALAVPTADAKLTGRSGEVDCVPNGSCGQTNPWTFGPGDYFVIRAWNERQQHRIGGPGCVHVDTSTAGGQYGPGGYTPDQYCIPLGKRVDSHFLHFHPATNTQSGEQGDRAQGCASFDGDIFGIETWHENLDRSEVRSDPLWSDGYGTIYPTNEDNRGLEPPDSPGPQTDIISDYTSAVCMDVRWYGVHDEVRVVTAAIGSVTLSPYAGQPYVGTHPVDSQVCLGATARRESFGGRGGQLAGGENIQMNVIGPNSNAPLGQDETTDGGGFTHFCYTGSNAGGDTIDIFSDGRRTLDGTAVTPNNAWDDTGEPDVNVRDEAGSRVSTTWTKHPTSTSISCPGTPSFGSFTTCTVTVTDTETDPNTQISDPTGAVTLTPDGGGGFSNSTCGSLQPSGTTGTRTCTVRYTPTSLQCGVTAQYQGDAKHNVSSGHDDVTCGGKIIARKVTQPGSDPQDFDFDTGGGLTPASFQLDTDPGSGLPSTFTIPDVNPGNGTLPGGDYSVAETLPGDGWWDAQVADPTCTDNSPASGIGVQEGETITCTFTNIKRGTVVVKKQVVSVHEEEQDFDFTTAGGLTPTNFQLDDDANAALSDTQTYERVRPSSGSLAGGAYSAQETIPANGWWDLTGLSCNDGSSAQASTGNVPTLTATVKVDPGETVTCTFTNTKRGTVVVKKQVVSVHEEEQDFDFTTAGGLAPTNFQLDDDTNAALSDTQTYDRIRPNLGSLPGGTYSAQETLPGDGWWDLTGVSCDDASSAQPSNGSTGTLTATYDLEPGETVTCTFENTKRATLIVDKQILPGDTADQGFYFNHMPCGDYQYYDYTENQYYWQSYLLAGQSRICEQLVHGSFTIDELDPGPAYKLKTISCDDDTSPTPSTFDPFARSARFELDPGETVRCTYTNEDQRGVIVLDKVMAPSEYPDAATQGFGFHGAGPLPYGASYFYCSNSGSGFYWLDPAYYGNQDNVSLAHGQSARCDLALPGDYTIQESDYRDNYKVTGIQCDDGASGAPSTGDVPNRTANIHLDPRETVHCTFTNDDQRGRIDFGKTVAPGGYANAYTKQFGFHGAGTYPGGAPYFYCSNNGNATYIYDPASYGSDTANLSDGQNVDCNRLTPGSYTIQESDYGPDFKLTDLSCDDGGSATPSITDPFARTVTFNVDPHETVDCEFTNDDQRGRIIIRKEVADGGYDDAYTKQFGFHGAGTYPGGAPYFYCSNNGNATYIYDPASYGTDTANLSDGQEVECEELSPGSYTIQESDYGPDFKLTDLSCDDGSSATPSTVNVANRTATFEVDPHETVICTFTNDDQRGGINFDKTVAPDGYPDAYTKQFGFHGAGTFPGGAPYFYCSNNGNGTYIYDPASYGSDTANLSDGQEVDCQQLSPGSYTIQESDYGPDFKLTDLSCDDGNSETPSTIDLANRTATFELDPHERVNCHFTNDDQRGGITFDKTVAPGGYPDAYTKQFGFHGQAPFPSGAPYFYCSNNGNAFYIYDGAYYGGDSASLTDGQSIDCASITPGSYTIQESDYGPDFKLTDLTCDDGSSATPSVVDPFTRTATFNVDPHERVNCHFTNDDRRGRIILRKTVAPGGSPDAYTKQFGFHGAGTFPSGAPYFYCSNNGNALNIYDFAYYGSDSASLTDGQSIDCASVTPGSYALQESNYGPDFELTGLSCDDGGSATPSTTNIANRTATFRVDPHETVTCTVTNTDQRGKIIVRKDATPDDPQDFSFTTGASLGNVDFQLDDDGDNTNELSNSRTFDNLAPGGGYAVSESVPAGWDQTAATCSDGSSPANVDVGPGETVTCTFANRKRGKIVVVKDAQPEDPQDFSFTAGGGLLPATFDLDDDGDYGNGLSNTQTFDDLVPGSGYSVAEGPAPAGWDKAGATCDDGSPVTNVNVSAGETVTCTFTNKKRGTIVIEKDAFPDETDNFTYTAAGGLSPTSFQLDDDPTDATLPNTRTFSNVIAKNGYTVTENNNFDFAIGVRCDDDASATPSIGNLPVRGATINLDPGETVTCTFVNTGVYPRPGGGTPYRVPLVPAFKACTAPNRTHVAPLDKPSCSPWALESTQLKTSSVGSSLGFVRFVAVRGDLTLPGDQADVTITVDLTDVRRQSDDADYPGKLILATDLRITDRSNYPPAFEGSGTVYDTNLSAPIDCVPTTSTGIGSRCQLQTSMDALSPGYTTEEHRSIMSMLRLVVNDAGIDGSITPPSDVCPPTCGSGDEKVFMNQGVFTP